MLPAVQAFRNRYAKQTLQQRERERERGYRIQDTNSGTPAYEGITQNLQPSVQAKHYKHQIETNNQKRRYIQSPFRFGCGCVFGAVQNCTVRIIIPTAGSKPEGSRNNDYDRFKGSHQGKCLEKSSKATSAPLRASRYTPSHQHSHACHHLRSGFAGNLPPHNPQTSLDPCLVLKFIFQISLHLCAIVCIFGRICTQQQHNSRLLHRGTVRKGLHIVRMAEQVLG